MNIKGTTQGAFQINAGSGKNPFTLDASGFTSPHLWKLPDSDGSPGYTLSTDSFGNLSWQAGGSPNLDGGIASSMYGGSTAINGGGA